MQTDGDMVEIEKIWGTGIDYIFIDSNYEDYVSLELMYSTDANLLQTGIKKSMNSTDVNLLQTGIKKSSSTKIAESLKKVDSSTDQEAEKLSQDEISVEHIYRNPYFTMPKIKSKKSNEPLKMGKKKNGIHSINSQIVTDDYLQFLSNWFMYVLQKDK